ncbi:protein SOSEKI 5-like isoform X2 [Salvia splendens]|uniref:protein SOSEKI 5-like isoform X2 n=1 Tax=Salvia splendens TaxID=180675 RepID=UPI001C25AC02|nr:protein SOSEKI 5-like isoform X2 [Salvia splendens]
MLGSPQPQLKSVLVPVLYYLSRNGQLDHPHFMEVPLSSPRGLFLKDVINRLNALRGNGMAFMYSWSSKRSYKNGFVWHDLSEDDLIIPAHGHDYILKGSAFLNPTSAQDYSRRRNQSCSSIDFDSKSADVSTQTEDNRRGSQPDRLSDSKELEIEISPPPSDSRPETLGTLLKADGQVRLRPETASHRHHHFQRCRSSMVLMQLISCGSMPFRDCGTGSDQGMVGRPRKLMAPRGTGGKLGLEEKEYFSGSIVETNKREFPALKRSSSYNADRWRSLNLEVAEK